MPTPRDRRDSIGPWPPIFPTIVNLISRNRSDHSCATHHLNHVYVLQISRREPPRFRRRARWRFADHGAPALDQAPG